MAIALRKPPDPALWLSAHRGEDIHEMSGTDFEDLLAVAFQCRGDDVELTEHFDGGADLVVTCGGERWSVQAKRWDRLVDASAVKRAIDGMSAYGCTAALVVTNSFFDRDARSDAAALRVQLWDQKDLANLLRATGVGQQAPPSPPECPRCRVPMLYRQKLGAFWGCPNYQRTNCTETVPYHALTLTVVDQQPATRGSVAYWRRVIGDRGGGSA
jgi:hypothetical protein